MPLIPTQWIEAHDAKVDLTLLFTIKSSVTNNQHTQWSSLYDIMVTLWTDQSPIKISYECLCVRSYRVDERVTNSKFARV